jgi:hypothetical protein
LIHSNFFFIRSLLGCLNFEAWGRNTYISAASKGSQRLLSRGAGVWTQGFTLAKQALYHLSHISSRFSCGYFEDGVLWTTCHASLELQSSWFQSPK